MKFDGFDLPAEVQKFIRRSSLVNFRSPKFRQNNQRGKHGTSQSRIGDRASHHSIESEPSWPKTAGLRGARAGVAADSLQRCGAAALSSILFVRVNTDRRCQRGGRNLTAAPFVAQRPNGVRWGAAFVLVELRISGRGLKIGEQSVEDLFAEVGYRCEEWVGIERSDARLGIWDYRRAQFKNGFLPRMHSPSLALRPVGAGRRRLANSVSGGKCPWA